VTPIAQAGEVALLLITSEGSSVRGVISVLSRVGQQYPGPYSANWLALGHILPHALTYATWIEQAPNASPVAAQLLDQIGFYLYDRAQYEEAEPVYQRALAIREQQLGTMHPGTANSLNNLAELYQA
jgi:tetratricopeptide (TPR) repeat protein